MSMKLRTALAICNLEKIVNLLTRDPTFLLQVPHAGSFLRAARLKHTERILDGGWPRSGRLLRDLSKPEGACGVARFDVQARGAGRSLELVSL